MIGTTIESRSGPWIWLILASLGAAGCVAMAVYKCEVGWLAAASLWVFLGGAALLCRPPRFAARLTETGLELLDAGKLLRYDEIDGVTVPYSAKKRFCITLWLGDRPLDIARVNVDSRELLDFLLNAVPLPARPPSEPALHAFFDEEIARFGPEQVRVYRQRPPRREHCKGMILTGAAMFLGGLAFMALSHWAHREDLFGVGAACEVVGGIVAGVGLLTRVATVRGGIRNAALIVSPGGLALSQGALQGEMGWDELIEVKFGRPPFFTAFSSGPHGTSSARTIYLKVAGATIRVFDLYNRPLRAIYEQIAQRLD